MKLNVNQILFTVMWTMVCKDAYANILNNDNALHIAAHAGITYIITDVTEKVCVKIAGDKNKVACTITGVVLANGINVMYKASENYPDDTTRALSAGVVGSGLAATIISIHW